MSNSATSNISPCNSMVFNNGKVQSLSPSNSLLFNDMSKYSPTFDGTTMKEGLSNSISSLTPRDIPFAHLKVLRESGRDPFYKDKMESSDLRCRMVTSQSHGAVQSDGASHLAFGGNKENVKPQQYRKLVVPHLVANMDPAATNIPFRGKVLCTYLLMTVWTVVMLHECIIAEFKFAAFSLNPMMGPGVHDLVDAGAMIDYKVVDDNQYWRIVWTTQMHAGWIHLAMNLLSYWKLGEMVEPEWGFIKTLLIFLVSAVFGSLLSTTVDGTRVALGASGGVFGVLAALNVYIIEYWDTIPSNKIILLVSVVLLIISISTSFVPYVDSWAHVGGAVGGILCSLALLRALPGFKGQDHVAEEIVILNNPPLPKQAPKSPEILNKTKDGDRIHFKKMSDHIIMADVPSMARPALMSVMNPAANRWSLRCIKHTRNPITWFPPNESYDLQNPFVWSIRILALIALLGSYGLMIYFKFFHESVWARNLKAVEWNDITPASLANLDAYTGGYFDGFLKRAS